MVRSLLLSIAAVLILAVASAAEEKTLGFTVDELPRLLQASLDRHDYRSLTLGKLRIKPHGDNRDLFVIPVESGLKIGGTVNRTSRNVLTLLVSLDLSSAKENTVGLQYLLCAGTMMEVCSPELTGMQRDAALREVGAVSPGEHLGEAIGKSIGAVYYWNLWTENDAMFVVNPL